MSNKLIVAAAIALFAGAATAGDVFVTLDTDMNGAVSRDEASAMPGLTEQWEALDVDINGELSAEEFAKYVAAEEKPATNY